MNVVDADALVLYARVMAPIAPVAQAPRQAATYMSEAVASEAKSPSGYSWKGTIRLVQGYAS